MAKKKRELDVIQDFSHTILTTYDGPAGSGERPPVYAFELRSSKSAAVPMSGFTPSMHFLATES